MCLQNLQPVASGDAGALAVVAATAVMVPVVGAAGEVDVQEDTGDTTSTAVPVATGAISIPMLTLAATALPGEVMFLRTLPVVTIREFRMLLVQQLFKQLEVRTTKLLTQPSRER